jgi:hypothetical protein
MFFIDFGRPQISLSSINKLEFWVPPEVANVILQAITSENLQLSYNVANDAATIIQARVKCLTRSFEK